MKTFTARDLSHKTAEIRQAVKDDGACLIQWKNQDRTVASTSVLLDPDYYDVMRDDVMDQLSGDASKAERDSLETFLEALRRVRGGVK